MVFMSCFDFLKSNEPQFFMNNSSLQLDSLRFGAFGTKGFNNNTDNQAVLEITNLLKNVSIGTNLGSNSTKVLICFLLDNSPSSPVFKHLSKSLKAAADKSKIFQTEILELFDEVYFNYLNTLNFNPERDACDEASKQILTDIAQILSRVYECLRNVVVQFNFDLKFLKKLLISLISAGDRFGKNSLLSNYLSSSSESFAILSNLYHTQYRLSNLVLVKIFSAFDSNESFAFNFSKELIDSYKHSILENNDLPFPVGVVIEASLTIIHLIYLNVILTENFNSISNNSASLSKKFYFTFVQFLNENYKHMQTKLSIALMSAFLLESEKSFSLIELRLSSKITNEIGEQLDQLNMNQLIIKLVELWPCKTETQFVYFTAMIYLSWTKYVLDSLNKSEIPETLIKSTENTVETIIAFAQSYWSFNSIEQVFDCVCNCIKISSLIKNKHEFNQFLMHNLYNQFYHSKNSLSVYRLLYLIEQSVEKDNFESVFKEIITKQFNLKLSIENFLFHSSIPTLEQFVYDEDDSDQNLDKSQHFLATYQISNRNIDLVRFITIRFNLMFPTDSKLILNELTDMFYDSKAQLVQKFFIKTLLPKMLQMKLCIDIIRTILAHLLFSEEIPKLEAGIILFIFQLNQQYSLKLIQNENDFLKSFIETSVDSFSDEVQLQTLALMIEHKKSTQPLPSDCLDTIFDLTLSCCSIQQASARDQLVRLIRKLYIRLEDSSRHHYKLNPQMVHTYCTFLSRLTRYCFDQLHIENYFGSLLIYLQLIQMFLTSFHTASKSPISTAYSKKPFVLNEADFQTLLGMIEHSFEEIKCISKSIIVSCHLSGIHLLTLVQITELSNRSAQLLTYIQPQIFQTGVVLCELATELQLDTNYEIYYLTLTQQLQCLKDRISSFNNDLISSTCSMPICPTLSAIRALLCKLDLSRLTNLLPSTLNIKWKCLISSIIVECMSACDAVSPIVCNESPEGHLPMDSSQMDLVSNRDVSNGQIKQLYITSQMLLLNGWMTVKESVNIISHLVASFPMHSSEFCLVTCEEARTVIDFLYHNQLNLVHRGAFEQSSYAFNRLITAVWKQNCNLCCSKFEKIILEIQNYLVTDDFDEQFKCKTITRRSAGLPFVMQSILAAEPSLKRISKGTNFVGALVEMLLSRTLKEPGKVVHSLNILKALIRDARLSEQMAPWIEKIFKVTIRWFDRNNYSDCLTESAAQFTYSIQNSASMLFSALVTRVFGVKRNKNDTSRKNRMSSLLFFQNFSTLYSFLLNQLTIHRSQSKRDVSSIYPTLIILTKLTPSISENSIFDVHNFLPPLQEIIFHCRDSRLRLLAVQTYVQLLQIGNYLDNFLTFEDLLKRQIYRSEEMTSANTLHGIGLILSELVLQYSVHLEIEYSNTSESIISNKTCQNDLQLNQSLFSIYNVISQIFVDNMHNTFPCPVVQTLHLLHSRIYALAHVAPLELSFKNYSDLLCEFLNQKNNDLWSIGNDEMIVNLYLNLLVHCSTIDGDLFVEKVIRLVSLDCSNFLVGQLLFWQYVNQLLLFEIDLNDDFFLRRHHGTQEKIFTFQTTELIYTVKRFFNVSLLSDSLLQKFRNEDFYIDLFVHSREWTNFVHSIKDGLFRLLNVQWDILHEIFQLVYNAVKSKTIKNGKQFLAKVGLDQYQIMCLLNNLERISPDENAYYSILLTINLILCDQSCSVDVQLYKQVSVYTMRLSQNATNNLSRQVSLQCLTTCLPVWIKSIDINTCDQNDLSCRLTILCDFFFSLFTLLQDNEKFIREKAAKFVRTLHAQSVDLTEPKGKLKTALKEASFLFTNTLKNFGVTGALFLLQTVLDIGLEYLQDETDLNAHNEEVHLFEKSKLNNFSDSQLLVNLLVPQLKGFFGDLLKSFTLYNDKLSSFENLQQKLRDISLHSHSSLIEDILFKLQSINRANRKSENKFAENLIIESKSKVEKFFDELLMTLC